MLSSALTSNSSGTNLALLSLPWILGCHPLQVLPYLHEDPETPAGQLHLKENWFTMVHNYYFRQR